MKYANDSYLQNVLIGSNNVCDLWQPRVIAEGEAMAA